MSYRKEIGYMVVSYRDNDCLNKYKSGCCIRNDFECELKGGRIDYKDKSYRNCIYDNNPQVYLFLAQKY